ncbi:MAG: VWA domain-containing protein [Gammaproteobacteria bacterium]|nr:VWA domain-containing protein [Gammaproteobacteria bacterium]MDA7784499.1 VWA domain-containing protein [Pseudomonadales bacterium]MBT3694469.1 VWA domain-containing protein [Gammaproteobacteria bacterium]MBT5682650.1 VWA domain-containing protein [Gammaproteobacteria bacterium]MBT6025061.1 VWA domain-containing protein [Gammaproteobacteria bacterium]
MLINFFLTLRKYKLPVTIRELMDLISGLQHQLVYANLDDFYLLSRTALVKDEKNYDKFDRAFSAYFKGLEDLHGLLESLIPDEWLRHEFEKSLSPEQLKEIESLGGLEKLIEAFKKAKEEAEAKAGEEGKDGDEGNADRQGQSGPGGLGKGKKKKAKKVWDERQYKNLDDSVELGTRNIKMALRRLRKFARTGAEDELDISGTIKSTAHNGGMLDIKMRPERRNTVKVLLFLDIGGSMDAHVKICEELFSASRTEFKHIESFYFHNFIYESVWKDNRRRMAERMPTLEVLNKFSQDYKVVFVGDATMAPYEITHAGGSVEHWNEEPGAAWMEKFSTIYDKVIWLNPTPQETWEYSSSVMMTQELVGGNMFPLTIKGLEEGMGNLSK